MQSITALLSSKERKKRGKKSFEIDLLHSVLSLLPISFRKPQRAVYLFKERRLNRSLEG